MGFMSLCNDDPLLEAARELFDATPLRTPEERVQPLMLLSRHGKDARVLGNLEHGVQGLVLPLVRAGKLGEFSGKQSRKTDAGLGLKLLAGFLAGFGVPATGVAAVNSALEGVRTIAFSFGDLERRYIDVVELGQRLAGKRVDANNPTLRPFLKGAPSDLLIIDSVLRSGSFTLRIEGSSEHNFSIDGPKIADAVEGSAHLSGVKVAERTVTFSGNKRLTFAFSCVQIDLGASGRIDGLVSNASVRYANAIEGQELTSVRSQAFFSEPGLLIWDGDDVEA
jgi:hypothetical protein